MSARGLRLILLATCGLVACSSAPPPAVTADPLVRLVASPIAVPQPPQGTGVADVATDGASDVWVAHYDCAQHPSVEIDESLDGGVTWVVRGAPVINCSASGAPVTPAVEMRFVDASHGVVSLPSDASSDTGRLYVTADAGRTWSTVTTPWHLADLGAAAGRIWATLAPVTCLGPSPCPTSVATSADDGRTWIRAAGTIPEPGAQILPLSANILVAGSTRIWRTTDGGASWHELANPCPTGVPRKESRSARIQLAGGQLGLWAACEIVVLPTAYVDPIAALVYRSVDGGATWQETPLALPAQYWPSIGAAPDRSISAPDASTAWLSLSEATAPASSSHPEVVATVDAGRTWHVVFASTVPASTGSPVQNFLVSIGDHHPGWVTGPDTYQTQDGGMHWMRHPLPTAAPNH